MMPVSYFRYEGGQVADFVCSHGYDSQTCGVTQVCPEVGQKMLEWYASLDRQTHVRIAKRTMMVDSRQTPDLADMNKK